MNAANQLQTIQMDFRPENMQNKFALHKHVTLALYTQVRGNMLRKYFGLFHADSSIFRGHNTLLSFFNWIRGAMANPPIEILFSNFTAVQSKK